ncbi:DNA polymerase III subunit delta [Spirochaetota bacterium]
MAAARYPNSRQFKNDLKAKKLEHVYLFMGEEEGEKDKFIQTIMDLVFKDEPQRNNYIGRFHIENGEILNAADFALSQSMFSSNKVCIMRNIDSITGKDDISLFLELISGIPTDNTLVMTTTKNKPPSFIPAGELKKMKVVHFWRYFDSDIFNYINLSIRENKLEIDDRAVSLLVELTGKDIKKIDDAIEMLKYSGERGIITVDVIHNIVYDVKDVSEFEFIDCLFKRDIKSLKLLKKIIEDGKKELLILNMISRQLEKIEKYYLQIKDGVPQDEAVKKCGIYEKNKNSFITQTRHFPLKRTKEIFPLISRADFQIKSSKFGSGLTGNPIFNLVTDILYGQ